LNKRSLDCFKVLPQIFVKLHHIFIGGYSENFLV
jgi:hypothetical protein